MKSVTKTSEQVKEEFIRKGVTVEGWSKKDGFKSQAVRRVLRGQSLCKYGVSHKIAVLLGLKDGEIEEN